MISVPDFDLKKKKTQKQTMSVKHRVCEPSGLFKAFPLFFCMVRKIFCVVWVSLRFLMDF